MSDIKSVVPATSGVFCPHSAFAGGHQVEVGARNPNPIIVDENGRLLAGARRLRQRPLRGRR